MIVFACAKCGKRLKVGDDRAGKRGKCPICGEKTRIPQAGKACANGPASAPGNGQASRPTGGDSGSRRVRKVTASDYAFLSPAQGIDELGRLAHYRVLNVLGAGGMGIVFEAEDTHLQRHVALKCMRPALVTPSNRERFLQEARATAAIEHDHIVTIYQVSEDNGVPFLAMKLLQGQSLEDKLKEEGGWLPLSEVLRIGRETAEALDAAHAKGLIHRDIKPANIWLEGERGRVKIVDFGLARAAESDTNLTQEGLVMGTPAYMSPEQADDKPLDHRSDLFSLGCVLYRAVTGQLPFKGKDSMAIMMALATKSPEPPHSIDPMVPVTLSDLIMELLAKDPDDRPRSAHELKEALEAIERQPAVRPPNLRRREEESDLKPLDDDIELAEEGDEDVVVLEIDENPPEVEEVVEVQEVEEVEEAEEVQPRRSRSGARAKRHRDEAAAEQGSDRAVIIIGVIVAGIIVILLAFIFIRRAMRSEPPASSERTSHEHAAPASAPTLEHAALASAATLPDLPLATSLAPESALHDRCRAPQFRL
jgi:serine/threonine protein kinase